MNLNDPVLPPGHYRVKVASAFNNPCKLQKKLLLNGRFGALSDVGFIPRMVLFQPGLTKAVTHTARRLTHYLMDDMVDKLVWLKSKGKQPRFVRVKRNPFKLTMDLEILP